jgi:hypothetical protein
MPGHSSSRKRKGSEKKSSKQHNSSSSSSKVIKRNNNDQRKKMEGKRKAMSISGDPFKVSKPSEKVKSIANNVLNQCRVMVEPVPIKVPKKYFVRFTKNSKELTPKINYTFLTELIKEGVIEKLQDFRNKYLGYVLHPKNSAPYLIYSVSNYTKQKYLLVPPSLLKHISLAKDSSPEIMEQFDALLFMEMCYENAPELKEQIDSIECIKHSWMASREHAFFTIFEREGKRTRLPIADTRAMKGLLGLNVQDVVKQLDTTQSNPKEKKKAINTKRKKQRKSSSEQRQQGSSLSLLSSSSSSSSLSSQLDDIEEDKKKMVTREKYDDSRLIQEEDILCILRDKETKYKKPSVLLEHTNSQSDFCRKISEYLPEIPASGSTTTEVIQNLRDDKLSSFSLISGGHNVITPEDFKSIMDSRISLVTTNPFCTENKTSSREMQNFIKENAKFFLAGQDPSIAKCDNDDNSFLEHEELESEEKIALINALFKPFITIVNSATLTTGEEDDDDYDDDDSGKNKGKQKDNDAVFIKPAPWFQTQSKDIIDNTSRSIESILRSPEDISLFFSKTIMEKETLKSISQLYMQHKRAAGMIDHLTY